MLTTVAALIIVLGLMISLARHVRARASDQITADLLARLVAVVDQYEQERRMLPEIKPLFKLSDPSAPEDEEPLRLAARVNNAEFVRALRAETNLADELGNVPLSIYDELTLRDAWGSPIVYMPAGHRDVGLAANDRFFFFSAGPDRKYLTREDNLYSYEEKGSGVGGQGSDMLEN